MAVAILLFKCTLQVLLWAWCMTRALNYRHLISSLMLRLWRVFVTLGIVIMIIVLQICVLTGCSWCRSQVHAKESFAWSGLPSILLIKCTASTQKNVFALQYLVIYFWGILDLLCGNDNCVNNTTSKIIWCCIIHLLKRMKWYNYFKSCPVTVRYYLQIINSFYQLKEKGKKLT